MVPFRTDRQSLELSERATVTTPPQRPELLRLVGSRKLAHPLRHMPAGAWLTFITSKNARLDGSAVEARLRAHSMQRRPSTLTITLDHLTRSALPASLNRHLPDGDTASVLAERLLDPQAACFPPLMTEGTASLIMVVTALMRAATTVIDSA